MNKAAANSSRLPIRHIGRNAAGEAKGAIQSFPPRPRPPPFPMGPLTQRVPYLGVEGEGSSLFLLCCCSHFSPPLPIRVMRVFPLMDLRARFQNPIPSHHLGLPPFNLGLTWHEVTLVINTFFGAVPSQRDEYDVLGSFLSCLSSRIHSIMPFHPSFISQSHRVISQIQEESRVP